MARSQLPDVLRHNNKPPPDEVEKHLELPPGTLSCQLANYLLHPAVSGQRSGVTTSNAPQNCDTLNVPWPAAHAAGGCCYHLHKPPPPPRAFSLRLKLQQLMQRLSKAQTGPSSCPAAQASACGAVGLANSPRQRWIPPSNQGPQQGSQASQVAPTPARLNGAPLLLQHGGQSGGASIPSLGLQRPSAQQLLPYTIDGGSATPKARVHPVVNNLAPTCLPRGHQGAPAMQQASSELSRFTSSKSAADRQGIASSKWEPCSGAREKSKSITERDVGAVIPALAWGGEEAMPCEQDLSLPEPKSPFYPLRSNTAGGKLPMVFPPCTSWTPIEPPPAPPSIPLSALQASLRINAKASSTSLNAGPHMQSRQVPEHIQPLPVRGQAGPKKSQQQLMQQQGVVSQHLQQQFFEIKPQQDSFQAGFTGEDLNGMQLKAPESAFGVFERPMGSVETYEHEHVKGKMSTEYLPSARGSRTLPEDAGWNTASYQPSGDLGPWQFAGLV